jgi:hypothetical protein
MYSGNGEETPEICKMLERTQRKKLLRITRNRWKDNIRFGLKKCGDRQCTGFIWLRIWGSELALEVTRALSFHTT